jgi:HAD superfamily hydrolase (TIGR01509 family)
LAGKSILNKEAYKTISFLAKSHPLMICTSGSRSSVKAFFEMSDLSKFFVGALDNESIVRGKPDPEIYLKASKMLGVRPQDCWVIEDSEAGCTAAYRAGTRLMILDNKNCPNPQLFPGSKLINQLDESLEYIE